MATDVPVHCSPFPDNAFGPVVEDCARAFDFTLLFEESILAILPSAILLVLAPVRLISLSRRKRIVGGNALRTAKLLVIVAFGVVQVGILTLWALHSTQKTKASIAAAVLHLVNAVVFAGLSYSEHAKSFSPSALLNAYLLFSVIFDAVRTRTLWMMPYRTSIPALSSVSVGLKILILFLEEVNKNKYIHPSEGKCAPEETAGVFSRTLFWWLNRLIWTGFSSVLTVEKLPAIDRRLCSESLWTSFLARWQHASKGDNHALLWVVFGTLKWAILAPVIPLLCIVALTVTQPLLINAFLDFLSKPSQGTEEEKNFGYGLIAAYGLVYIALAIATAWAQQSTYRFVSMIRGCLVTAIYRKTVSISTVGLDDAAAVTLMSTDVERIVTGLALMHEVWTTLLQIAISLFLLYRLVGTAFVVPLLMFLVCGAAVGSLAGQAGARQAKWMSAIEKRVGVTSSMLGAMKGVKISGLTGNLSTIVSKLRLDEIASARLYRNMLVYIVTLSYTPNSFSPIITFGAYIAIAAKEGTVLDSTRIFTTLSLLALITEPLTQFFHALPEFFAAVACFGRIQKFLLTEPRQDKRECRQVFTPISSLSARLSDVELESRSKRPFVLTKEESLDAVTIQNGKFGWKKEDLVLQDVNLRIATSQLTIIIGQVGCGKTTLLKAILGETPLAEGSVAVATREMAYCDQTPWLTNQTLQMNITGFSKYDAGWYSSVLKACALEDDLAQLPSGDQCMVGSKGITLSGGQKQRVAIARAVYARRPIALFDDVFSGLDSETQKQVFDNVFGLYGLLRSQGTTIVLATHAVHLLPYADCIIALGTDGQISAQGTFDELNVEDGYLRRFDLSSRADSSTKKDDDNQAQPSPLAKAEESLAKVVNDQVRRLGDKSVYKYYFQSIGWFNTIVFFAVLLIWIVMLKFPEIWLKWWGDSNERNGQENGKYIGVYAAFQVLGLLALAIDARHLLLVIVVKSGRQLHSTLLKVVLNAPMSFLAATDTGAIVNRFSQDIQLIDAELPISFLNVAANSFVCVSQAIMILPASYWLVFTYPFLFGTLYAVQKYYLRTSRQLRFLDLEAKSPLYSQFLETLNGLTTVRAFSWEDELVKLNEQRLDSSQKPFYLLFSVQRWLNLVLDLIAAALAIILTAVAVSLRGSLSAGFVGIALYNIMNLSSAMKAAVTVWTLLETSIGAVARVKIFEETTPSEHLPTETGSPPDHWPDKGRIVINGVTAAYNDDSPSVLNKVSLTIRPGEKVGICGRSGSGKSSLILAMFRMIELKGGAIKVDGVDISTLPRELVRGQLNAIPQEPFFLSGSFRENCDPRAISTDQQIQDALQEVRLWDVIESKGGLDAEMTQDCLSHGQKQLFCLARAVLHPSKVVIMDEATSSVDVDTDKIMQQVIRAKFKEATVIAVAHRLETILDFDKVIVMKKGVLIEQGNPQHLLTRQSAFKALYDTYDSKEGGE